MSDADEALPAPPAPRGAYRPAVAAGAFAASAGMTPRRDGALVVRGRVGTDVDLATARAAAALAARNALAAVADACGGLEGIEQVIQLVVYIAAGDDFAAHSQVADGASEALAAHLGERAGAARAAVGVASLPDGAPVEVQLVALRRTPPASDPS